MSKSTIKNLLQSMTKAEIIEMVLELYSARKEAKDHRHAFPFAERLWLTSRSSSRPLMPLRN